MKRIAGCWMLVSGFLLFSERAIAQTDTTSYFEIKLYNTQNKLVTGKNVDLYQGVTKKYDLTESSSVPGVYAHATVNVGEYDLYVNGSAWKSGLWIGSNKVTSIADLFRFTSGADTMRLTGHIRATSFEGDGSKLTGITGSVVNAIDDLELKADHNANRVGSVEFKLADTVRANISYASLHNQTNLIVGNANSKSLASFDKEGVGSASLEPAIQLHTDTTGYVAVVRLYPFTTPNAARYAYMAIDDINNQMVFGSTETGDPPGTDLWPMVLKVGAVSALRIETDGKIGINLSTAAAAWHLSQGANYTSAYGLKVTSSASGDLLADGLDLFLDSSNNAYFNHNENGYLSVNVNGAERMRLNPTNSTILRDTTRVEKLRLGTSQTANYGLITDASGNITASALPMIGDTTEISVFLDSTASNSGSGNSASLTRLGIRRSLTFWSLDDANSDTLLFSVPIPEYADSLEYVVLPYRVNATSGTYYMSFSWEFTADDAAVDNSLTYTSNLAFTAPAASASGDWKMYRKSLSPGTAKSTGSSRWLDGMLIRVGGNGSDTASGNMDLSTEVMLGWSRKRGY